MNENRNSIEIDLRRIFVVLLTRAWLIILVAVICGAAAFSYAKFGVRPTYSASVKIYVNNNYSELPGYSSSQLEAANRLANTYNSDRLFSWAPKSLQMVTAAMRLEDAYPLEEKP